MIRCSQSGVVYRNPKPYLRAVHAWHPSLVKLDDGRLLCAFDLGEAVESLDYRTYISRSTDGGRNWDAPQPMIPNPAPSTTHTLRIARPPSNGELVSFGGLFYRNDPEQGLTNRANMGFVPMDLIVSRSHDKGVTWDSPVRVEPPLVGPAFEVCHAIIELNDGRWLAPTQTWRGWNGEAPNGMKAIALVSEDRGATWPTHIDIFDGTADDVIHFEQSVVQLSDGRLLATAWAFHEPTGASRPIPYAVSRDGRTFGPARSTGLLGETAKLMALPDGRFLCAYRRLDQPGLWAALGRLEGDAWVTLHQAPVWQGPTQSDRTDSTSEMLGTLKLGFPQMLPLSESEVFLVFWCCEDMVYQVRWARLDVSPETA